MRTNFYETLHRLKRIKTSGKFRPLICKISEHGAKLPTWTRSPQPTHDGLRNGCGPSSRARLCWPVLRQRNVPVVQGHRGVAFHAGPFQTLLRRRGQRRRGQRRQRCGVWACGLTSWQAFGRVSRQWLMKMLFVQVDSRATAEHSPQLLCAEGSQSGDGRDDDGVPPTADAAAMFGRGGLARQSAAAADQSTAVRFQWHGRVYRPCCWVYGHRTNQLWTTTAVSRSQLPTFM